MALTTTVSFTTSTGFTFNSSLIGFSNSAVQLAFISVANNTLNEDFATSTGFTYTTATAEFTGGLVQSVDQRPSGAVAHATYTNGYDLVWGGNTLTGFANTTTIAASGGILDLDAYDFGRVSYDLRNGNSFTGTGAVRFKYNPFYSGNPPGNMGLVHGQDSTSTTNNFFRLFHGSSGNLNWQVSNNAGTSIFAAVLPIWQPTTTNTYEFELNIDVNGGVSALFIDGVQFGNTQTSTGTRGNVGYVWIGADVAGTMRSYGSFDDLMVFNAVQHTANYTAAAYATESIYSESRVQLPTFQHTATSADIFTFDSATITGSTSNTRLTFAGNYWDGNGWTVTSNTYATAGNPTNSVANIATLTPTGQTLQVDVIFGATSAQGQLSDLTVTYTYQGYSTANPDVQPNAGVGASAISAFSTVETATGNASVRWTLRVDGTDKYYPDSATGWTTSDGTYAQANTAADVNTNVSALDISSGASLAASAILSADTAGAITPFVTSYTVEYDFFISTPATATGCIIYGFATDLFGVDITNGSVVCEYKNRFIKDSRLFLPSEKKVDLDSVGKFTFDPGLIETSTNSITVDFTFNYTQNAQQKQAKFTGVVIPDTTTAAFIDLTGVT